jgi:hypothetical protein
MLLVYGPIFYGSWTYSPFLGLYGLYALLALSGLLALGYAAFL